MTAMLRMMAGTTDYDDENNEDDEDDAADEDDDEDNAVHEGHTEYVHTDEVCHT